MKQKYFKGQTKINFKCLLVMAFVYIDAIAATAAPVDCRCIENAELKAIVKDKIVRSGWGKAIEDVCLEYTIRPLEKLVTLRVFVIDSNGEPVGEDLIICEPSQKSFKLEDYVAAALDIEQFKQMFRLEVSCSTYFDKEMAGKGLAYFLFPGKTYYWHPTEHKLSKTPGDGYEEILVNIMTEDYAGEIDELTEKGELSAY
jgi:hypothetical protein